MSVQPVPVPVLEGPLGPALFKVIRGVPTPEELAVVTALLTALSTPGAESGEGAASSRGRTSAPAATWDLPDALPPASWMARA
ncbi:acyl-CoA carboxylase subunit epsilon [Streptomyces sp. NBC_00237]|uniref:acyl-CoA carboxylase subunit epsilon n=1 Tax=Streptomyces sp. NBC_00237 TaxID=2975687 RepID=UPI002254AEBB|nr:acyl-CoA carboxylase subunit epsilon [Streptomyces sp. NBC_00237]MCX5203685.1 acyl-CoA carboxylase subunit epsilon [Streptomyces sp. NBC_00237]